MKENVAYLEKSGAISQYGWKARFDRQQEVQCKPFSIPRLSQLMGFLPMSFRYAFKFYIRKRLIERRLPFLDPTRHVPWRPIYGVPMGGIGCGSIGRGFRGEFVRSNLIPGMYSYEKQPADQFILTIRQQEKTVYQQVLSTDSSPPSSASCLRGWSWGFPPEQASYVGLYPRSWTVYEIRHFKLIVVCEQISPVLPHDYKTSSLPCCVFRWKVFNFSSSSLDVSISFSWHGPDPPPRHPSSQNAQGSNLLSGMANRDSPLVESNGLTSEPLDNYLYQASSFYSEKDHISGCTLNRLIGNELPCCFGVAAQSSDQVTVRRTPGFLFDRTVSTPIISLPNRVSFNSSSLSAAEHTGSFSSYKHAPSAQTVWNELQSASGLKDDNAVGFAVPDSPVLRRQPPKLAVMVSASCTVPIASSDPSSSAPGEAELVFGLVWHSPLVRFRANDVVYRRRYVRWFPEPDAAGAIRLLEHALLNWPSWVRQIEAWQKPILDNTSLPDFYKSALFNELYYLTDGGSVWLDPIHVKGVNSTTTDFIPIDLVRLDKHQSDLDPHRLTGRHLVGKSEKPGDLDVWKLTSWEARCQLGRDMGLFAYLEGHEYRMFNTVDVHFFASWAFIKLWPKLQLAVNYDCADLTIEDDRTETYFIHDGCYGVRHVESSVPHDFGDPENEPWRDSNAYIMFPTDQWKDLSPKFILQVWRDWKLTNDHQYMLYNLPIVCRLVRSCQKSWDSDGDGMIEHSGFPDQTFDTWKTHGISAYTGGLWLACVYAAKEMLDWALSTESPAHSNLLQSADENDIPWIQIQKQLQSVYLGARDAYDRALWTGYYYAYQSSRLGNHKSIMAAQLCGHWFLRLAGAPADAILPSDKVLQTLKTIEKANWRSIEDGKVGAVNGVLPNLKQDFSNVQSEEFWVGVNYAVAATFVMEGMTEQGLSLATACYNTVYNRFGLQFQTPEAYMLDGRFRCPGYMRPLAIWSIQHALELQSSPAVFLSSQQLQ